MLIKFTEMIAIVSESWSNEVTWKSLELLVSVRQLQYIFGLPITLFTDNSIFYARSQLAITD